MRRTSRGAAALVVAIGVAGCGADAEDPGDRLTPAEVLAEADRMAATTVWPGFDPDRVPVAFYHDSATWLYRHPSPPEGFEAVEGEGRAWRWPGRHPAVTANTSVELGGVQVATVLLDQAAGDARRVAGLLIHEAFHVFQREHHPEWAANEVSLFTYPVDDPAVLAEARLELMALRRAIEAEREGGRCWAREALDRRSRRFGRLSGDAVAYERGTELNEGLARYVENRVLDAREGPTPGEERFGPDQVRQRGYETGLAQALLLDRYHPDWKAEISGMEEPALDPLLDAAIGTGEGGCGFDAEQTAAAADEAAKDVGALVEARQARLDRFRSEPGWSIELRSPAQPLFPRRFDPLNVAVLGDGLVLHTRQVSLQNGGTSIDVLGDQALTEAAGPHPLFNGVRSITITGLADEPEIVREGDTLRVSAEGLQITAGSARLERAQRRIVITVEGSDA